MIGNIYRPGKLYTTEPVRVNDHDFESLAEGKIVPHGLYDIHRNRGYIVFGTSHVPLNSAVPVSGIGG